MTFLASSPAVLTSSTIYILSQLLLHPTLQHLIPLSPRDALLSSSKLVGGTHALLAGGLALREILDPKWLQSDLIQTKSSRGDGIVALEAGYLIGGMLSFPSCPGSTYLQNALGLR